MAEMTVKTFNDYLGEGKIMGSCCKGCGAVQLPPRPVCTKCGRHEPEWIELQGEGTIQAYTIIAVPLTRLKESCPYAVGVVRLDDGPSISGMIVDVKEGDKAAVGTKVKAEFVKEGEKTALCFRVM
jgi:hypothetical protein